MLPLPCFPPPGNRKQIRNGTLTCDFRFPTQFPFPPPMTDTLSHSCPVMAGPRSSTRQGWSSDLVQEQLSESARQRPANRRNGATCLGVARPESGASGVGCRRPSMAWRRDLRSLLRPRGSFLRSVYIVSLGIQVLSQKVRMDPANLHNSVSNHILRRYDWIPRV